MGKHDCGRLTAILVSLVGFAISLVFNGLSVVGIGKSEITVIWTLPVSCKWLWMSTAGSLRNNKILTEHVITTIFYLHLPQGPYHTTTANVSAVFDTQITPSGWTFNIWSVIYVWLTAMVIYIVSGLCRKLWSISLFFSFWCIFMFTTSRLCKHFTKTSPTEQTV